MSVPTTRTPLVEIEWEKLLAMPKRTPWVERASQIQRAMPALAPGGFDWTRAFKEDLQLYADVYRAILALEGERTHTWGPRPLPSVADGDARLKQMTGQDYSLLHFRDAFALLTRGMSKRQVAHRTGITATQIQRLRTGEMEPDAYLMEQIAKAFRKQPGFFLEYRMCAIFNALHQWMSTHANESSISIYRKILSLKA